MRIKTPWGKMIDLEPSAPAIWRTLERGVVWALSQHGTPPDPYASHVAYRREPNRGGRRRDYYQPWWECAAQLHGDCEDLAMWLVGYLRGTGEDPTARVALIEWPGGGWHAVVVRYGEPERADHRFPVSGLVRFYGPGTRIYAGPDVGWDHDGWYVEDPSRRLGMRDTARPTPYSPLATGDQREPRGDSVVGRDPFVPFEVAGSGEPRDVLLGFLSWMEGAE